MANVKYPDEKNINMVESFMDEQTDYFNNENTFVEQLHNVVSNNTKINKPLVISKTPNSIVVCGADSNLDFTISKKTIDKCLREEIRNDEGKLSGKTGHGLTEEQLVSSLKNVKNPVLVLNGNRPNTLIVVSDCQDDKERQILISIVLNKKGNSAEINDVSSVYGRENFSEYMERQVTNILAVNKEKAEQLFQSIGKKYPEPESVISFDNSIAYTMANVKYPDEKSINKEVKSMDEQALNAQLLAEIKAMREEMKSMREEITEMRSGQESLTNATRSTENSLRIINGFIANLNASQTFEKTMQAVENVTKDITGGDKVEFVGVDGDKFYTTDGETREYIEAKDKLNEIMAKDFLIEVMAEGRIFVNSDLAVVPMKSNDDKPVGWVIVEKEGGFDGIDLSQFEKGGMIMNSVTLAIDKEQNHHGMVTDEMTQLKNKDGLNEYLKNHIVKEQDKTDTAVIMSDIDHFKWVNDNYGHKVGDMVIRGVADILAENTRNGNDCAFRVGGEEMVCIVNCNLEKAAEVAERIRKQIEDTIFDLPDDVAADIQQKISERKAEAEQTGKPFEPIPFLCENGKQIKVTASFGVSEWQHTVTLSAENVRSEYEKVCKIADDRLYTAKESGRNQVCTEKGRVGYYNREEYSKIENKHFINDLPAKVANGIIDLAEKQGVMCSGIIDTGKNKSTVTLDGNNAVFCAMADAYAVMHTKDTKQSARSNVSHNYKNVTDKFRINNIDERTAEEIAKTAAKEKAPYSVKYNGEKSYVILDGSQKSLCNKAVYLAHKNVPGRSVEEKSTKMAEWGKKASEQFKERSQMSHEDKDKSAKDEPVK